MQRLKYILLGLLAILLTGCGQTVVETLHVPENPGFNAPGTGKSVVILPFADYSNGNKLASAQRRNTMITEALTDRLVANGFSLPVNEDVFRYLIAENIISVLPYNKANSATLSYELGNDWSPEMKAEIQRHINLQNMERGNGSLTGPGTHGLSQQAIAKLGRKFHADYIVRGRILEYKTRDEARWEPWKKGILPFINGGVNRILFGFASTDSYDIENQQLTGGILGARIGHQAANWPWSGTDKILGISGSASANAILWGAAGYALSKNIANSGKVDQAVVQLRIWVQEAATGNVIWTNRIKVQVVPESLFADKQYDILFNQAIEKGVTTLIENFVTYGL